VVDLEQRVKLLGAITFHWIRSTMNIEIKFVFTAFILIIYFIIFFFVDFGDSEKFSFSVWRGGKSDPFRKLILNDDGSFKKNSKLLIGAFLSMILLLIWGL